MNYEDFEKLFSNKKAIIFDLDGTLIDSMDVRDQVDFMLVKKITGKAEDLETIRFRRETFLNNFKYEDFFYGYSKFLHSVYRPTMSVDELHFLRHTINKYYLTEVVGFKEGAVEFVKQAYNNGLKLGVATMSSSSMIKLYRRKNKNINTKLDFDKYFGDNIITRDNIKKLKPNPEVFIEAMEKMGVNKEETLVIEDSYIGVMAAKKAGIDCISIYDKNSDPDRDLINSNSSGTISDFNKLKFFLDSFNSKQFQNQQ